VALFHFGFAHGDPRRPRRGSPPGLLGVTSVVFCNMRLPVNFRYAPLAIEIARRCNMPAHLGI